MAQGFLNSVDPVHAVSNLFRSEQGVYICFLVCVTNLCMCNNIM